MYATSEFWLSIFAALLGGFALGAIVFRSWMGHSGRINDVRWRRRLNDSSIEHDKEIRILQKALKIAEDRDAALRKVLAESDETVKLLSADRRAGYEEDVAERNRQIASLKEKITHLRADFADAKDEERVFKLKIEKLSAELDENRETLAQRNDEIRQLREHASQQAIEQQLKDKDEHITTLESQFESLREKLPTLNDALREREASIEDLLTTLSAERRKSFKLEQAIATSKAAENGTVEVHRSGNNIIRFQPSPDKETEARTQADRDIADNEHRIYQLEQELQSWKKKYESARSHRDHISDHDFSRHNIEDSDSELRRIRGIGPAVETRLNEAGIFHVEQLANLDKDTMDKLAMLDQSLPGRIRRYRLVEQAQALQDTETPDQRRPNA